MPDSPPIVVGQLVMREFEFIHAAEDVPAVLRFAAELGLIIRRDEPTINPEPDILNDDQISNIGDGVFILYRSNWVFGEFVFGKIRGGYNEGKYSQNPSTNYASITAYFGGEKMIDSVWRLGAGLLGRSIDWYRPSDHSVQPAPPDVKKVFNTIREHIDTRRRLRGGVHKYAVLERALKKLSEGRALPPFDYIEWPTATGYSRDR